MTLQKKVLFGGIGAAVVIAILVGIASTATPASTNNNSEDLETRISSLLGNDPERIKDPTWRQVAQDVISTQDTGNRALLVIYSDTRWSGAIQNSDLVQQSIDGYGSKSIPVLCDAGGIYSVSFQKATDYGVLNLYMAQDGKIIKQGSTGAEYGVVTFAGNCI